MQKGQIKYQLRGHIVNKVHNKEGEVEPLLLSQDVYLSMEQ